jgi:hypothetical protein
VLFTPCHHIHSKGHGGNEAAKQSAALFVMTTEQYEQRKSSTGKGMRVAVLTMSECIFPGTLMVTQLNNKNSPCLDYR